MRKTPKSVFFTAAMFAIVTITPGVGIQDPRPYTANFSTNVESDSALSEKHVEKPKLARQQKGDASQRIRNLSLIVAALKY